MGTGGHPSNRMDMHLFCPPRRFHRASHRPRNLARRGVHVPLPPRQVYPTLYSIYHHLRRVSCIVYQVIKHHQPGNKQHMDHIIKQLCSHFNNNCISPLHLRSSTVSILHITPCIRVHVNPEPTDWTSPALTSISASVSAAQQSVRIQAPRPMAPPSSASAVLQYRHPTASGSSTPSEDSRGKKRALDGDVEAESSRPRKRNYPWPLQEHVYSAQIKSDEDAGIQQITFSSDGDRFAVICEFIAGDFGKKKCIPQWHVT